MKSIFRMCLTLSAVGLAGMLCAAGASPVHKAVYAADALYVAVECRKRPGPKADEATKFLDAINAYKLDFDCGYTRLKIIDYILDLLH